MATAKYNNNNNTTSFLRTKRHRCLLTEEEEEDNCYQQVGKKALRFPPIPLQFPPIYSLRRFPHDSTYLAGWYLTQLSLLLNILSCLTSAGCRTVDPGLDDSYNEVAPCVFPFTFKGIEYDACTTTDNSDDAKGSWCCVALEQWEGHCDWGYCDPCCDEETCPTPAPTLTRSPSPQPSLSTEPTSPAPTDSPSPQPSLSTEPTVSPSPTISPSMSPTKICEPGTFYNNSSHVCEACSGGSVSVDGSIKMATMCSACGVGTVPNEDQSSCEICSPGMEPNSDQTGCNLCKPGQSWAHSDDGNGIKVCLDW